MQTYHIIIDYILLTFQFLNNRKMDQMSEHLLNINYVMRFSTMSYACFISFSHPCDSNFTDKEMNESQVTEIAEDHIANK